MDKLPFSISNLPSLQTSDKKNAYTISHNVLFEFNHLLEKNGLIDEVQT